MNASPRGAGCWTAPSDLDPLLPALVGPLDDKDLRDALIAWVCPGWLPPDAFDDRLREPIAVTEVVVCGIKWRDR